MKLIYEHGRPAVGAELRDCAKLSEARLRAPRAFGAHPAIPRHFPPIVVQGGLSRQGTGRARPVAVNARPHPSSPGANEAPEPGKAAVWPPGSSRKSGFERTRPRPEKALDVLVVDDDESSRELIAVAIHSFGHRCRVAFDGADALRQLAESPADVVVSDWDMPRLNGGELCRRVRAGGNDAPYTYFIIMTAFDDREHLLAGMAAGADDYQRKPVSFDELEARLLSAGRVVDLHRRLASRTAALIDDSTRNYLASRTDALTGVGNRMRLDEELATLLSRAQRYGHRCSLAICDLDFFKALNDRYGHVAGDEALRCVADCIRTNLRSSDAVYRYGGEEFVVLLVEQSLTEAEHAMQRMRIGIERLGVPSAGGAPLTVSIGLAEVDPAADHTPAEWVARADRALYAAKAAGRNRVMIRG